MESARQRVAAAIAKRAAAIRADRIARRGLWQRLAELFGGRLYSQIEARLQEQREAQTRANKAFRPRRRQDIDSAEEFLEFGRIAREMRPRRRGSWLDDRLRDYL